jgi:hypothetical protein
VTAEQAETLHQEEARAPEPAHPDSPAASRLAPVGIDTVRHGFHAIWADWWRVRTLDGQELGRRVLLHSHVEEQPFTREERIRVPRQVRTVVVEAHDKVHGRGGATVTLDLSRPPGPKFPRGAR